MAELKIEGDELVLELSAVEKVEAVRGDVRVPASAIRSVTVIDDPLDAAHGIRVGTGVPGVLVVGTIHWGGKSSFVVVHHGHPRGVLVELDGAEYDEFIVGTEDPETMAAGLARS